MSFPSRMALDLEPSMALHGPPWLFSDHLLPRRIKHSSRNITIFHRQIIMFIIELYCTKWVIYTITYYYYSKL